MPFGTYQGDDLKDSPVDYLVWVLANVRTVTSSLRQAIQVHLNLKLAQPGILGVAPETPRRIYPSDRQMKLPFDPDHDGTEATP
jgi:uncharacterized protein (DUF3820 family)